MKAHSDEKDFQEISRWLSGAKAYYLQAYRDSDGVLIPGFSACSEEEMKNYRDILSQTIPVVEIRGMELCSADLQNCLLICMDAEIFLIRC